MFEKYFSFSGTLTKEEYKERIIQALKAYLIVVGVIVILAILLPLTNVIESLILSVVMVISSILLWSIFSIMSRFMSGNIKKNN